MMAIEKKFQHAHVDTLLLTRVLHSSICIRLKLSFLTTHLPCSEPAILGEQDNTSILCYLKRKQQSLARFSFVLPLCPGYRFTPNDQAYILGHINKPTVAVPVKKWYFERVVDCSDDLCSGKKPLEEKLKYFFIFPNTAF